MSTVFQVANLWILPFWATLLLAPRSAWSRALLQGHGFVLPLALVYLVLVGPHWAELLPLLARPELPQIQTLFSTPWGSTVAWLHILCFDLLVGRWMWQDAETWQAPNAFLKAALLLTLLFGPIGMLTYWCGRLIHGYLPQASPLSRLAAWMVPLLVLCLLGLVFDPRLITALPAWIKPLKFTLSILVYALTLEAVLACAGESRWARRVRAVTASCLAVELAVILLQALRGTTSHFNRNTPLDALLFALMGLSIAPVWLAAIGTTALLSRRTDLEPSLVAALRWGLLVAVTGMAVGWPMSALGSHTVGAVDGGPGLPLLGWSTQHGDLRVAHFVGMHALQVLPLLWLALRGREGLASWLRAAGAGYLGLTVLLTAQALAGRSFLQPDPAVLGWVSAWGLFLLWTLPRRSQTRPL